MFRKTFLLSFVAAVLHASNPAPLALEVDSIGVTVSDLDRSVEFYGKVLGFEQVVSFELDGSALEQATGVFGSRARTARLRLGSEYLELTEYLTPRGRAVPADSRSNDRWFQHIAIVTRDMQRAYRHLRENGVRHSSPSPQRLPDWNPNAGGIEAFYFQDPDGHPLEIISFPAGKGAARWRESSSNALFLGIDHTAIVISSTEASTKFYRDLLGLAVAGESENWGPEQERLNNVFGARLRIRAFRAARGPGIEFLEYVAPSGGRPYPADARPNDLFHWQTRLRTANAGAALDMVRTARPPFVAAGAVDWPEPRAGYRKSILIRDPDGHAVQIVE